MARRTTSQGFARRKARGAGAAGALLASLVLGGCGSGIIPLAPSNVIATSGPGTITVAWTDNSVDETGFAVLRSTGGDYAQVASVPVDSDTYLDADVGGDVPYTYKVAAVGPGGRALSEPSDPVRAGVAGVPVVDPDDPIGVSLNQLGIDTTATPRLGDDGQPLPNDYLPLGPRVTLGADDDFARYELFIGGAATSRSGATSNQVVWEANDPTNDTAVDPVYGLGAPIFDVSGTNANLYDVVSGDFDGDGLDEYVLVSLEGASDSELTVSLVDDAVAGFAPQQFVVASRAGVTDLEGVAADFDGDGTASLAVGLGGSGGAELLFLQDVGAGFALVPGSSIDIAASVAGATTFLALASGNLDDDAGQELAVVINESFSGAGGSPSGVSRYRILDDANAGHATLTEGSVQGQDGAIHTALVADVGVGNIDGDDRDEVVFGGITEFHETCTTYDLLYVALDDAKEDPAFRVLGAKLRTVSMGPSCTASKVKRLRYIHVELGDVDGDGVDEIVGGPMVFDDWSDPWAELGWIPADQMYGHGTQDAATTIGHRNSALAVVDMDGNGAAEIVAYMPRAEAVIRYVLPANAGDPLTGRTWWGVDFSENSNGSRFRPMLVPANVDEDSMVAKAVPNTYRFTMTEPIIVAALAGAPCNETISQNLGACGTSYGQGTSSGVEREQQITISASVSIGMKAIGGAFTQSELTAKGKFQFAASYLHGYAYELEKSVVYATGPLEDAVIFSAVPYDAFTYVVVQHPDPTMIGKEVDVMLPRDPITVLVERSYFNDAQAPGNLTIGSNVFQHVVGDPGTYRTPSQRDALLDDLANTYQRDALQHGPVTVGQGSGSTSVSIDVAESVSNGFALEIGFEYEVEAVAATVLTGFSVGISAQASFGWSWGTSTSYAASVGNIADPTEFAVHGYGYGMFTYVFEDDATGQQFEVIDFWVE